jgi:hypothetical protein
MAEQRPEQRGLAHAVAAEEPDAFSGRDDKIDTAQHVARAVVGVQTARFDQCFHRAL